MINVQETIDEARHLLGAVELLTCSQASVIARARTALNDNIVPYRWQDSDLSDWCSAGNVDIRNKRHDAKQTGVHEGFENALYFFVLARAYEVDAGNASENGGIAASYQAQYENAINSADYSYPASYFQEWFNSGVMEIWKMRPDTRLDYRGRMHDGITVQEFEGEVELSGIFKNALVYYICAKALESIPRDYTASAVMLEKFKLEVYG
jgi:hypothetical protein